MCVCVFVCDLKVPESVVVFGVLIKNVHSGNGEMIFCDLTQPPFFLNPPPSLKDTFPTHSNVCNIYSRNSVAK